MLRVVPCLALLALSCSPVASRRGDTVILASGEDLQSVNPLLTVHPLAKQVQRYALLVTLVRYDSTLQPEPYLAREWEWSTNREVLTLRLFTRLRWHDGTPTTALDAAWTLQAARNPATGYPRQSDLLDLRSAVAKDDSTLVLSFTHPMPGIPDVLTDLAILPRHLLDTVPLVELRRATWNRNPVGNGPFCFVSHEPNRRWVFERNDEFPEELGGSPRLERLVIAIVDEPTTKLAALTSGELDIAGIHPAHADFVRDDPRLAVLDYPLLFTYVLVLNTRRAPFGDVEVRRALSLAIDRGALVEGALFGFGTPAYGPIPPPLGPMDPESEPTPGESHALTPFEFQMLTVGSGEAALEQMLQAELGEIGVRAEIRQLELSAYLDRVYGPAHDFDAAVLGLPGDLGNGQLATLLDLAGVTASGESRDLLRLIDDSIPAVFLYHARGVQGMNRRVNGVEMDLRGELVTLSEWWVEGKR